jgi:hypothetical protein
LVRYLAVSITYEAFPTSSIRSRQTDKTLGNLVTGLGNDTADRLLDVLVDEVGVDDTVKVVAVDACVEDSVIVDAVVNVGVDDTAAALDAVDALDVCDTVPVAVVDAGVDDTVMVVDVVGVEEVVTTCLVSSSARSGESVELDAAME